jgi:ligand-binding SRPBCC domain-containing protein
MHYVKETLIRAAPEKVFGFHLLPDAFERLVPPWEKVKIIQKADITRIGSRAIIESKLFGFFKVRWVAEHTRYEPPRMFEDVQISGPFKKWRHQHIVVPHAEGAILKDEIEFEPPMSIIGRAVAPSIIVTKMEKMFAYRHEVTRKWAEAP